MMKRNLASRGIFDHRTTFPALLAVLILLLVLAGCGGGGLQWPGEAGKAEQEAQEGKEQQEGKEGLDEEGFAFAEVSGGSEEVMVLKDIDFGDHTSYERVVVEFVPQEGNPRYGVPRFRARFMQPPYVDAEGNKVDIEGNYLIELYFCGNAADLSMPEGYKLVYHGPQEFSPGLSLIDEAKLVPAYELNSMILVIGLGKRAPFRVEELLEPPRIVIDVKK